MMHHILEKRLKKYLNLLLCGMTYTSNVFAAVRSAPAYTTVTRHLKSLPDITVQYTGRCNAPKLFSKLLCRLNSN